jgi:tetratricopeptide (TPR) repeat protein
LHVSIALGEAWRPALRACGPSASLGHLYLALAALLNNDGHPDKALDAAQRAAEIARLVGDARLEAEARAMCCEPLLFLNRVVEAIHASEEVARLAEWDGDLDILMGALSALAWFHENRGDLRRRRHMPSVHSRTPSARGLYSA